MATTWAVKMDEEEKERLQELIEESGLSNKEFIGELIQTYELNRTKEVVPILNNDIDELQKLTSRINSIFIGLGERIDTLMTDKDNQYRQEIEGKESIVSTLQQRIDALKQELQETDEQNHLLIKEKEEILVELVNLENEIDKKVNQYNEVNQKNTDLIEQYKEKIDTLTGLVQEYKQAKEDNKGLILELDNLKHEIDALKSQITKKDFDINSLKERLEYQTDIHKEEITRLREKLEFEKEKEILQIQRQYQEELQSQREQHNQKVGDLLEKIEELEIRYDREEENKNKEKK